MSFRIALSGLNTASTDLEVTGNNIANAATTGFKESRVEFGDLYASAIQDTSNTSAGQGVRVARVAQQFNQGSVDFTSNNLDLAISGQGFFVVEGTDGVRSYTRAGAYNADRDGFVLNASSQRLQVYPAAKGTDGVTSFNTGVLSDLQLPTIPSSPSATTKIDAALNLDASVSAPAAAFSPGDASSYNSSRSLTAYDSLGNAHTATTYFRKTAANAWDGYLYIDGNSVTTGAPATAAFSLAFDSAGALAVPATGTVSMNSYTPAGGAAALDLTLDFNDSTQFGSAFSVNNLSQNGYTSGRLTGVDIDTAGVVFARYTNGQSEPLGKVALAKFNNQQGMRKSGDTNWQETYDSGTAQLGEASTSSFGQIQSGALEASNVDIAEQLVRLITAQRNFQSNAEVISTADQITQSIINIR